jgi:hypothetical protein
VLSSYSAIDLSTATVDVDKSMTEIVTRGTTGNASLMGIAVLRFTAATGGVGASNKNNGTTGNPTCTLTTTQDNSAIVVVWSDWTATAGTAAYTAINSLAGIVASDYPGDGANYGAHVAYYSDVGTAGAKTVTVTGVTNPKWQIAVVEVKGSVGGGPVYVPPNRPYSRIMGM